MSKPDAHILDFIRRGYSDEEIVAGLGTFMSLHLEELIAKLRKESRK